MLPRPKAQIVTSLEVNPHPINDFNVIMRLFTAIIDVFTAIIDVLRPLLLVIMYFTLCPPFRGPIRGKASLRSFICGLRPLNMRKQLQNTKELLNVLINWAHIKYWFINPR